MTLVDSLDSVLMLYAYASPSRSTAEGKIGLFQQKPETTPSDGAESQPLLEENNSIDAYLSPTSSRISQATDLPDVVINNKLNVMSSLSITLTALSIMVALRWVPSLPLREEHSLMISISVIEVMGMIGEICISCSEAADSPDGGGLTGAWWRFWAKVSSAFRWS
jgi:high-affinity nickel-transport protein